MRGRKKPISEIEWSQKNKNNLGLPRPFFLVPEEQRKKSEKSTLLLKTKIYLHKKIPVPWQTEPIFNLDKQLNLIFENELRVYLEGICAYCGIDFKDKDDCIRWKTTLGFPTKEGPNILSDNYPFHIKCMEQARIFCPKMRQTENDEYEYGNYKNLKNNFMIYLNSINSEGWFDDILKR